MNKRQAIKELNQLLTPEAKFDPVTGKFHVGTSALRAAFGESLDKWSELNDRFNPSTVVAQVYDGGYSWSCYYVFKNTDRTFAIIVGSGCSCNRPENITPEIFPDEDSTLQRVKHDMDDGWFTRSQDARRVYHQFLSWIVGGRK